MNLTAHQKRKLRISFRLIVFGFLAGLFFVILADGLGDWFPIINGIIIGIIIAIVASIFELYIYEKSIRKQPFITVLITRSLFYITLIIIIIISEIGIARMIKENLDLAGLLKNESFNQYIYEGELITAVSYAFALVIIINFTRQISRKLGHGVMASLITGRYFHPRELRKIFMFLNMPTSAAIIEKIGRMNFHSFINEVVYDITLPIMSNHGIIYQYVEDEMVITWKEEQGTNGLNALRCFFDIKEKIKEQEQEYIKKYGVAPECKCAIHIGKVVKGEIGHIKSEIVYHGDVLNTTSRMLDACNDSPNEILISAQLLKQIDLPENLKPMKCGDIKLKGKKESIELFTIENHQ